MNFLRHILSLRAQGKVPQEYPQSSCHAPRQIDKVVIFTTTADAFSVANTNVTVADSLECLARVVQGALDKGIRVRGYISVVITCPYSGNVDYKRVRDVTKELLNMGCYEVSLSDTVTTGMGDLLYPRSVGANPEFSGKADWTRT
jgi:isopropylmalate/homocitrate/citramalate synthase